MTLQIMAPILIGAENITASNVDLETEWTAGTYNLGDQARVGEVLYEVSAATTTEEPSETASDWFNVGPANRFAAFDMQFGADKYRVIETVTSNAESITYTLEGLTRISGIAMFGLSATNIRIVGTQDTTGDVCDIDYDLQDAAGYSGSFWRWMFLPQSFERKYLNFDVNIPKGAVIEITISRSGGTAEVSAIGLGIVSSFGRVTVGTGRSLKSRSVKKTEGTLTSLLRRTASATISYNVVLTDYEGDPFWRLISDIDGIATIFSGQSNHPEFSVYGIVRSAQTTAEGVGNSKVALEVESL
jgi:hypothetical protein